MNGRESADETEAAAARWVWRLDREGRTPTLAAELDAWLAVDPRRQGALLQAEATWAMLDRGRLLAGAAPTGAPVARSVRLPRRALLAGGGTAIAASIIGAAVMLPPRERYDTAVGEIRRVPLSDGSTAAINTQSVVEVDIRPKLRVVKLARGEAWFQVAKNSDRPFVVEAGRVRVRAVGTAFSVRRRDGGAEVLVSEGVVEAWTAGSEDRRIRMTAGETAFLADDAGVASRQAAISDVDRQLAWRAGKIDLAGETLAESVEEFNRYNTRRLVVTDPRLAQERFYGVFRTDDPIGFANAVRQSLGAEVVLGGSGEIRIGPPGA